MPDTTAHNLAATGLPPIPPPVHVYRHRAGVDDLPPAHAAAVLSRGPWVVVHYDGSWQEFGGGYNLLGPAISDALRLAAGRGIKVHA